MHNKRKGSCQSVDQKLSEMQAWLLVLIVHDRVVMRMRMRGHCASKRRCAAE